MYFFDKDVLRFFRLHTIIVDYQATIDQYFRIPVAIEKNRKMKVFSDFRAVGVRTHVHVAKRDNTSAPVQS